mmetsp:Transcript_36179/g.56507  ORF Transcript_36179/g.56507 Transcript_36179/m.56507 type:complete len:180 (+) Transcript_36179:1-540(+)
MQLELLSGHLQPGSKALDVGSGSGYISACMARMVQPGGVVVGIEHISELTKMSEENIKRDDAALLKETIRFICGDGRLGVPDYAPYDAIHVGAAAPELPQALVDQLSPGGRMVCPVGPKGEMQSLVLVDKDANGQVSKRDIQKVIFVPLTDIAVQVAKGNSTKFNPLKLALERADSCKR